ncbi:MAG: ThuA domain-containing protein [Bacteroidetes bacterium]|nr:ThuA domain-containing protein [Bacteroidota bacterium]MDA0936393.1 ThuA domain-containing protein [Bacteroidota bacterium]
MKIISINFSSISALLFFTLLMLSPIPGISQNDPQEAPSLKGKNIIYVYGGWKGHKPTESVDLMVPKLRAEGANVKVFDTLSVYTDEKLMAETDLIIQVWTMGKLTKEQFRGLEKAVMNGTGLSGWHGGMGDAFRDNLRYQFMVGGQFVSHPGGNIDHSIRIIDQTDPITKGLKDFELKKTEQYYMLIDPNIKVLAISEFDRESYQKPGKPENKVTGSTMPVVWKKHYGKGRIFYSSIGHKLSDFDVPEVMTMQMRGFRWAAEGKYMKKESTIDPAYP